MKTDSLFPIRSLSLRFPSIFLLSERKRRKYGSPPQKPFHYPFSSLCLGSPRRLNLVTEKPLRILTSRTLTAPPSWASPVLSFFLIHFQTNLFMARRCLSAQVASTMRKPLRFFSSGLALTLKIARNYSSAVFLHFTFAGRRRAGKNGSRPAFFISPCSSPAVILHFKRF